MSADLKENDKIKIEDLMCILKINGKGAKYEFLEKINRYFSKTEIIGGNNNNIYVKELREKLKYFDKLNANDSQKEFVSLFELPLSNEIKKIINGNSEDDSDTCSEGVCDESSDDNIYQQLCCNVGIFDPGLKEKEDELMYLLKNLKKCEEDFSYDELKCSEFVCIGTTEQIVTDTCFKSMPNANDILEFGNATDILDHDNGMNSNYYNFGNFSNCFANMTMNLLESHFDDIVISGGSVLRCLQGYQGTQVYQETRGTQIPNAYASIDVDIFFINGLTQDEIISKGKKIYDSIKHKKKIIKTDTTINILVEVVQQETIFTICLQLVLKSYVNIKEILLFFDIDCCKVAYDGKKLYATPSAINALSTGINVISPLYVTKTNSYYRLYKYMKRGFKFLIKSKDDDLMQLFKKNLINYVQKEIKQSRANKKGISTTVMKIINNTNDIHNNPDLMFDHDIHKDIGAIRQRQMKQIYTKVDIIFGIDVSLKESIDDVLQKEERRKKLSLELGLIPHEAFYKPFYLIYDKMEDVLFEEGEIRKNMPTEKRLILLDGYTNCYICKKIVEYNTTKMCTKCDKFNRDKRELKSDLSGKIAIVTGARIKIGYETTLKLLRNGCIVIGTTRFPEDAFKRYQNEDDYNEWSSNLSVVGLDLRYLDQVNKFVEYIKSKYKKVDILINNAAQTVRKPTHYYKHLFPAKSSNNLINFNENNAPKMINSSDPEVRQGSESDVNIMVENEFQLINANEINNISMYPTMPCDKEEDNSLNNMESIKIIDEFGERKDLRIKQSWNYKMEEISDVEFGEVQLINNISPSILVSKLKILMIKKKNELKSIIVNVTSPEGQFSSAKNGNHVHTNMSKAALNMMTKTCANDFSRKGILMYSVDTGWITSVKETFIKPPLDCYDGACRILDPVFMNGKLHHGVLYRNYKQTEF